MEKRIDLSSKTCGTCLISCLPHPSLFLGPNLFLTWTDGSTCPSLHWLTPSEITLALLLCPSPKSSLGHSSVECCKMEKDFSSRAKHSLGCWSQMEIKSPRSTPRSQPNGRERDSVAWEVSEKDLKKNQRKRKESEFCLFIHACSRHVRRPFCLGIQA